MTVLRFAFLAAGCACLAPPLPAQGNYEVQVYGSDVVPRGATMLEFHTNFTARGTRASDGVLPTHHALHETLEITHGWNGWSETGVYLFTSLQPDGSWKVVGTHLRPRVSVPERYRLPVGLSLSMEIGYQRPNFSPDRWSVELRPIVDKKMGRFYWSFNPTFEKSLAGPASAEAPGFSPNLKASCDVIRRIAAGVEYYASYGPVNGFEPLRNQQQQILAAVDLNFGERWEFNFGVGLGVTRATDRLLVKWILGRTFGGR